MSARSLRANLPASLLLAAGLSVAGVSAARAQTESVDSAAANLLTYTQALSPAAIRVVQARLHDAGVLQTAPDGVWSIDSQAALRSFQQTRGLQVTGQLNQATVVTLGLNPVDLIGAPAAAPAAPPPAATAAPPPGAAPATAPATPRRAPIAMSGLAVRLVQERLRANNYYNGPVDGVWGPASEAGLVRLQQSRGLPVTGRIDAASVQALGFDPDTFPPP